MLENVFPCRSFSMKLVIFVSFIAIALCVEGTSKADTSSQAASPSDSTAGKSATESEAAKGDSKPAVGDATESDVAKEASKPAPEDGFKKSGVHKKVKDADKIVSKKVDEIVTTKKKNQSKKNVAMEEEPNEKITPKNPSEVENMKTKPYEAEVDSEEDNSEDDLIENSKSNDSESKDNFPDDINLEDDDVDDNNGEPNDKPAKDVKPREGSTDLEAEPSGHFMMYFITAAVVVAALYVAYHNRHKLLAFIVEGRRSSSGGRRRNVSSTTVEYRQLSNAEEGATDGSTRLAETPKGYAY